jgi:hypothetical protein
MHRGHPLRHPGRERQRISGGIGAVLGIIGFFLGQRRLAIVAIVIGVAAVFFMAAASTGMIPGVSPIGHGYD